MTSNWRYNLGPIGMGGGEILFAILPRDDSLRDTVKDLEAIATKTFPDMAIEGSLLKVAYFIAGYQLMWSELGNLHPRHQFGKYVGREPLFTDSYCRVINKKVTPKDYLLVFRDFLEKWAYHLHTGDEKRDWYKAQDKCSSLIRRIYHEWDYIPPPPDNIGGGPSDPFN